jgi:hypothetical protein
VLGESAKSNTKSSVAFWADTAVQSSTAAARRSPNHLADFMAGLINFHAPDSDVWGCYFN